MAGALRPRTRCVRVCSSNDNSLTDRRSTGRVAARTVLVAPHVVAVAVVEHNHRAGRPRRLPVLVAAIEAVSTRVKLGRETTEQAARPPAKVLASSVVWKPARTWAYSFSPVLTLVNSPTSGSMASVSPRRLTWYGATERHAGARTESALPPTRFPARVPPVQVT